MFVAGNRRGQPSREPADMHFGPAADDNVYQSIRFLETGMSAETKFTIFCLESYKVHKALTGKQAAELFEKYGVYEYIREFYDVLHTAGYQHVNHDLDIYLKARGAVIPV